MTKIKDLKKVYKEFLILKENLEKKPEACHMVNGSLHTYTNELVNLNLSFASTRKKLRQKLVSKYEEMVNEFLIYLQNINLQINEFFVTDTNLDLETLIKELKKTNKIFVRTKNRIANNIVTTINIRGRCPLFLYNKINIHTKKYKVEKRRYNY